MCMNKLAKCMNAGKASVEGALLPGSLHKGKHIDTHRTEVNTRIRRKGGVGHMQRAGEVGLLTHVYLVSGHR